MKILKWLGSILTGGIADKLLDAYQAKLNAKNDSERLLADQRISHLQSLERVLIAEQGSWMTRWIRPAIALPFVIYIFKIVVWDKVFGLGTTDPLSRDFHEIMMVVLGAYFLARPFEKWLKK